MCLPCCRGCPIPRDIPLGAFWKQLVSLGKDWLFWAVKPGQHRGLGEFCQPTYCTKAVLVFRLLWFQWNLALDASISFLLLVNSSLHGILFMQHSSLLPSTVPAYLLLPPVETHLIWGGFPQQSLWCRAGFCENYCFSLSLMFCSAPQTEKCR